MKKMIAAAAVVAAATVPSVASAQDVLPGNGFIAATAGIHDLQFEDEVTAQVVGLDIDEQSLIYGVVAGYDLPVGPSMFVGGEANYNFGNDVIDREFGVAARIGFSLPAGTKIYGKVGYQNIDVDFNEIVNDPTVDFSGFEDSDADFLVGVGADVGIGGMFLRANLDTVSFDTLRATAGLGVKF